MADECGSAGLGSIFLSFMMGAAIGGGLALLTAPGSGKETRDKVRQISDDLRDKIKEITDEAETRIKDLLDESRDSIVEKKDMLQTAFEAGKEALQAERAKHKQPAEPA